MNDNQYTKVTSESDLKEETENDQFEEHDDSYHRRSDDKLNFIQMQDKPLLQQIIEQSYEQTQSRLDMTKQLHISFDKHSLNVMNVSQDQGFNLISPKAQMTSEKPNIPEQIAMDVQRQEIGNTTQTLQVVAQATANMTNLGNCACGAKTQCLFNIESVFTQIGGFGLFQFIALLLLSLIRNYALFTTYGAALAIKEPNYLCRTQDSAPWTTCSREKICDRVVNDTGFQYKFDQQQNDFFENWYTKLDLTCSASQNNLHAIASLYFLGYAVGVALYQMPDKVGRKGTMYIVMPMQILAYALVVYGPDVSTKTIGSFLSGVLHIKISNSFTHIYELVQDKHRALAATTINFVDDTSLLIIGLVLKYQVRDIDLIFQWHWIIGAIFTIIYFLLIPESPKWLFYMEGPNSQRGIDALNYIAWVNRSRFRVPKCAKLDLLGQAIIDNQSFVANKTNVLRNYQQMHNTLNQSIINQEKTILLQHMSINEDQPTVHNQGKRKEPSLKTYCCHKKYRKKSILMSVAFASTVVVYFLGMYNSAYIQGDLFTNQIIFGAVLGLGNLIGGYLAEQCETLMAKCYLLLIMVLTLSLKIPNLEPEQFYLLYQGQVFILGSAFTAIMIIQERQIEELYASISLEMNFSLASFCTSVSPVIADLPDPYPTLSILVFCLVALGAVTVLASQKKKDRDVMQQTINELVDTYHQTAIGGNDDIQKRWITATGAEDNDNSHDESFIQM